MADANIRAVITAEDRASAVVQGFGSSLTRLGQVAGGLLSLAGLGRAAMELVDAFSESEQASTQLQSVLRSTGGVAGVTAQQATDLSKSLQQVTTFSDETVQGAENLLLTFTNIGRDVFPQATQAVLDVSTALGQDVRESAVQVGKALQDPILGMTNLRRVGVNFNETQRQTVQTLIETGHGLEAQQFILRELSTEFGGSAEAMANTFGGQLKILQNNLNDTQERMGEVLASGLRPLVLGINDFVTKNGQLVASLGIAVLAAGGFAAAVVAVAGAVGLALTIMGGPFTIVLGLISALLGVAVFQAVDRFQKKMGDTTRQFVNNSVDIKNNGANNFGATGQAAKDLAEKLGDIDEQMAKTTRDFRENLAQIVVDHRKKVTDLQKQLDTENKEFTEAQADKEADFRDSQEKMTMEHQRKVAEITAQIKAEQIAASDANGVTLNNLRVRLSAENEDYNRQFAENATKYEKDKNKAVQSHDEKANDLQVKLDEEKAFMVKHGQDLAAIQDVQLLDEIDKLKRSHEEQMAEFGKQKQRAIESAQQTTGGIAGAFNALPGQINGGLLNGVGDALGRNMATALKDAFKDTFRSWWNAWGNWVNDFGNKISMAASKGAAAILQLHFPTPFAEGGIVTRPTLSVTGEDGPEAIIPLSKPSRAREVMREAGLTTNTSSNTTVNLSVNVGTFVGTEMEKRKLAEELFRAYNDLQMARGVA